MFRPNRAIQAPSTTVVVDCDADVKFCNEDCLFFMSCIAKSLKFELKKFTQSRKENHNDDNTETPTCNVGS